MSAPSSDLLAVAASTTSSGFADGLGRRVLAFDREEGTMLERLVVRPELAAFEKMLRERVERVAALEDERIARPRTVERDADGALVVVSEFVPGSRLSDLLETSADFGNAPDVDAAFGYLLDVLPALCGLHAGAGFAHGTIAPSRTVLTPAGQVVLLDPVYGGALAYLRYGRRTLWTEFGILTPPSGAAPRLDVPSDIAQVVLAGVMVVLGRPLRLEDFPAGLPNLVQEVVDVAQIRGSGDFADGLLDFLQRALPLQGSRRYTSADDALIDLRQLASELGLHVCRCALVDFIEQMEPSGAAQARSRALEEPTTALVGYEAPADLQVLPATDPHATHPRENEQDLEGSVEAEINLEALVEEPLYDLDNVTEIEVSREQSSLDDPLVLSWFEESELRNQEMPAWTASEAARSNTVPLSPPIHPERVQPPNPPAVVAEHPAPSKSDVKPAEPQQVPSAGEKPSTQMDADHEEANAESQSSLRWRRAKRARSARSRKDKLRSAAVPAPLAAPKSEPAVEEKPPAPMPAEESWLVPPERAAAFEPAVPDVPAPRPVIPPPPPPPPLTPAPTFSAPAVTPAFADAPAPPRIPFNPTFPATASGKQRSDPFVRPGVLSPSVATAPPYSAPTVWLPPPPPATTIPAPAPMPFIHPAVTPQQGPLKLKGPVKPRPTKPPVATPELFSATVPARREDGGGNIPWKLVAAAVVLLAMGIAGGRSYWSSKPANRALPKPTAAAPAATAKPATPLPPTANAGGLEIDTQPAGAQVLLDGKPAGESPLTIDNLPAGRHTVTLVSSSGSVKRTIRIEAGRTAKLDVPIFSGWVGIYAPFIVDVAEAGRVIGTTEEPRLMLGPGRHTLT
jgi:PEGA domain